jgi:hypothetical protein
LKQIAQAIGRQLAREDFTARMTTAANDNTLKSDDEIDGEAT